MDESTVRADLARGRTIGFMNGLDALFLYLESPETPMHVGSLHEFEVPEPLRAGFVDRLRARIAERLDTADVFTRRLAPMPFGLANPAWVAASEVDLDHHVRRLRLPSPGTRERLLDLVASLHARLLDRDRPLWEMVVIEGLDSGRVGFYAKVHHAGLDGQAGVAVAQAIYDLAARAASGADGRDAGAAARRRIPGPAAPGAARVAAAGLRHNLHLLLTFGRRLPALLRAAADAVVPAAAGGPGARALLGDTALLAPRTVLNGVISRHRSFATVTVPMARARALAERHEATVNDVVLAACGGALRDWLLARHALPTAPLLAAVPVSLRARGDTTADTQAMMARMTLATDLADPLARLARIRSASRGIKGALAGVKQALPTEFPSLGLPWLGGLLAAIWGRARLADRLPPLANVVVSNVPGPPVPLYLEGARMLSFWPVSIPVHGLALNITVQSYADSLDFGLIACREAVPDVAAIAAGIAAAFDALEAAASRTPAAKPPEPARPARARKAVGSGPREATDRTAKVGRAPAAAAPVTVDDAPGAGPRRSPRRAAAPRGEGDAARRAAQEAPTPARPIGQPPAPAGDAVTTPTRPVRRIGPRAAGRRAAPGITGPAVVGTTDPTAGSVVGSATDRVDAGPVPADDPSAASMAAVTMDAAVEAPVEAPVGPDRRIGADPVTDPVGAGPGRPGRAAAADLAPTRPRRPRRTVPPPVPDPSDLGPER
jgi:diacylglycerol O-acyltransferase